MSSTPTLGLVKNAAGTLNWTNSMNTNLDELDAAIAALRAMVAAVSASVTSVYGRTGAVSAQNGDYNFSQIAGTVAASQLPPIPASDITGVLPVANGGTAATTGVDALQNLGGQPIGEKGQPNGYASLDGNGMLPSSQLPSLAIDHTYVVDTQAAMLALAANVGDLAVRSDINNTFILQTLPASTLANWIQVLTPASPVQSVNGQVGVVNLTQPNIPGTASSGANTFTGAQAAPSFAASGTLSVGASSSVWTMTSSVDGTGASVLTITSPAGGILKIPNTVEVGTLSASGTISTTAVFAGTIQATTNISAIATAASGENVNSPLINLQGAYQGADGSATDVWSLQSVLGTGENPSTTLKVSHDGSTGEALMEIDTDVAVSGRITGGDLTLLNPTGFSSAGAGGASPLPAAPAFYFEIIIGTSLVRIPAYPPS